MLDANQDAQLYKESDVGSAVHSLFIGIGLNFSPLNLDYLSYLLIYFPLDHLIPKTDLITR